MVFEGFDTTAEVGEISQDADGTTFVHIDKAVFMVDDTIVYPRHGAAVIQEIYQRKAKTRIVVDGKPQLKDVTKVYLKLWVAEGELTIDVPAENVDLIGIRDVVDAEGLERVFDTIRASFTEEPTNWSRRYKANVEKLGSGDVIKVSEVVRDLSRRDADRGLSAGEKRMLTQARRILVSELALAENTDEDAATARLDAVLVDALAIPLQSRPNGSDGVGEFDADA
jgi:CarD family transcriptional regulator